MVAKRTAAVEHERRPILDRPGDGRPGQLVKMPEVVSLSPRFGAKRHRPLIFGNMRNSFESKNGGGAMMTVRIGGWQQ